MSETRIAPTDGDAASPTAEDASDSREARIRRAAYARYEQRGGEDGHDVEDWLAAEAECATAAEPASVPQSD